jgi:hypothetical protein
MTKPVSSSAALPIANAVLRILIVVNWVVGAGILGLLAAPHKPWILSSLDLTPSPEADQIIWGLRAIAVMGLATIPMNYFLLKRLLAIIETVGSGDPFVAANAQRLRAIAWVLLALQIMSVIIGAIGDGISTPEHPIDIDAGFSVNGWLAVLLIFLLAHVFSVGARMRDELEGTV